MIDICIIQLKVIGYTHTFLSKLKKKSPVIDLILYKLNKKRKVKVKLFFVTICSKKFWI